MHLAGVRVRQPWEPVADRSGEEPELLEVDDMAQKAAVRCAERAAPAAVQVAAAPAGNGGKGLT